MRHVLGPPPHSPGTPAERPRRWPALAAALAVMFSTLAVLAGGLNAPATADDSEDESTAGTFEVSEGSLSWGVKESFRSYIGGTANGTIALDGGATRNADGTFAFPVENGSYDPDTRELQIAFSGEVHFSGHGGVLDLRITDPRVEITGRTGELVATVRSNRTDGTTVDYGEIVFAELTGTGSREVTDGSLEWTGITAALTADGAAAFSHFYPAGQILDPVSLDLLGGWPAEAEQTDDWTEPGVPVYVAAEANPVAPGLQSVVIDSEREILFGLTGAYWSDGVQHPASIVVIDLSTGETVQRIEGGLGLGGVVPDSGAVLARFNDGWRLMRPETDGSYRIAELLATMTDGRGVFTGNSPGIDPQTGTIYLSQGNGSALTLAQRGIYVYEERDGAYEFEEAMVGDDDPNLFATTNQVEVDPRTGLVYSHHPATGMLTVVDGRPQEGESRSILGEPREIAPAGSSNWSASAIDPQTGVVYLPAPGGETILALLEGELIETIEVAGPHESLGVDPDSGLLYVASPTRGLVSIIEGRPGEGPRELLGQVRFGADEGAPQSVMIDGDGIAHVVPFSALPSSWIPDRPVRDHTVSIQRFETPTVTAQPVDVAVGADGVAEFSVAVDGTPDPQIVWQYETAFGWEPFVASEEISGVATDTLRLEGSALEHGRSVRAVASNSVQDYRDETVRIGAIASDAVSLEVLRDPAVVLQPADTSVVESSAASFTVTTDGHPTPEIVWQRQVDGFWTDVAGDDFVVDSVDGISSLTVKDTNVGQSGALFRARVSNSVGTVYSRTARLTVNPAFEIPEEGVAVSGVGLEWSGSGELQAAPPFGGSNYFSAGVSEGDEATYRAVDGDVSIVHEDAAGERVTATYATRTAQVSSEVTQLAVLADGEGRLEADGSARIAWEGSWSVNFYGGLVPFALTDPVLQVEADGTGTLKADLSGYASSMDNPYERDPLDPVADVTVATFADVRIDPSGAVTVTPHYAGVEVEIDPAVATPQNRTNAGWGAWPQAFVDFHLDTGLSSYWYSSGGAADPLKKAEPFVVDFTGAELPGAPDPVAPSVTQHPVSVSIDAGGEATFSAAAEGTPAPTAQWQSKLADAGDWVDIAGATSPSYTISGVAESASGTQYRAVFTNEVGAVETEAATLTVRPADGGGGEGPGGETPEPIDPIDESDLTDENRGEVSVPDTARPGEDIEVFVGEDHVGDQVSVWIYSTPVDLGWHTVSAAGTVTVTIPADIAPGEHRIVVYDADGNLIGWDAITILAAAGTGSGDAGEGAGDESAGGLLPGTGSPVGMGLLYAALLLFGLGGTVLWFRRELPSR